MNAVVFDFDGLVVDTESIDYACWREVYDEHGVELALDEWCLGIGTRDGFDPYGRLSELIDATVDRDALRSRVVVRFRERFETAELMPGVARSVADAAASGLLLGLASSSTGDYVRGGLARYGLLGRFASVRCAEDVAAVKPEPDLYLAVLRDLGVPPAEAVALEDSPNGVLAAKRAGMRCVAVPNAMTAHLDFSLADLIVRSLDEIPLGELLERVAAPSRAGIPFRSGTTDEGGIG